MGGPGGIQGNGGFYAAKIKEYSKVGNSNMTRTEFREHYMDESRKKNELDKEANMSKNIKQIQNAAYSMYGMQLNEQSIFQLADINGDGYIANKEVNSAMTRLGQMAYMNNMNGGQSIGGGNAMGFLNQLGSAAGGIMGGGENGGSSGGGGLLETAGKFVKNLFG